MLTSAIARHLVQVQPRVGLYGQYRDHAVCGAPDGPVGGPALAAVLRRSGAVMVLRGFPARHLHAPLDWLTGSEQVVFRLMRSDRLRRYPPMPIRVGTPESVGELTLVPIGADALSNISYLFVFVRSRQSATQTPRRLTGDLSDGRESLGPSLNRYVSTPLPRHHLRRLCPRQP